MDEPQAVASTSTWANLIENYKYELACFGVISICYHVLRKIKDRNKSKENSRFPEIYRSSQQDECSLGETGQKYCTLKSIHFNSSTKRITYNPNYHIPFEILNSENSLLDQVKYLNHSACRIEKVPHIIEELNLKKIPNIRSPLIGKNEHSNIFGGSGFLPEQAFVYKGSYVTDKNLFTNNKDFAESKKWLLAGPRKFLHFKPSEVSAAIVTCGGLCPGLNVVIRQIFITLSIIYGCKQVWGIHFGYKGFYSGDEFWEKLTLGRVKELQYAGGTTLGSSRGGFDVIEVKKKNNQKKDPKEVTSEDLVGDDVRIADQIIKRGIKHVYVIGGDGSHKGIEVLAKELSKRNLQISVVGVPKTIDNDIPIVDKTFGFQTAVSEAIKAIRSAYTESRGVDYGIGLVRLMGRNAGFIALQATNASSNVDICLIPEFQFDLYGEFGVLEYVYQQLKLKKHLVIVVAEGAGYGVRDAAKLKQGGVLDASKNIKLPDIGVFLKKEIVEYCDKRSNDESQEYKKQLKAFKNRQRDSEPKDPKCFAYSTLKYIDPAYMIRTVAANSYDRKLCAHLASSAVHGAMAGYTNFTVGHINQTPAMIPISALGESRRVNKSNRAWQRLLAQTGQPYFLNDDE